MMDIQKQVSAFSNIIHKEGYMFIVVFAAISFFLASINLTLGGIGFVITAWCAFFFRNPDRYVPLKESVIVSPADGVISNIEEVEPPKELDLNTKSMLRVSIVLNIFNVHVNRIPISGKIKSLHYNPGKFFNATLDKASIYNERQSVIIENEMSNIPIVCVQIAGIIARRIVCNLEGEEIVATGDRYGIIRFGSRVDLYLPKKTILNVCVGQTCVGGETIIADLKTDSITSAKFKMK